MSQQEIARRKAQALKDAYEADLRDGTREPFTGRKLVEMNCTVFKGRADRMYTNPIQQIFNSASRIHKGW